MSLHLWSRSQWEVQLNRLRVRWLLFMTQTSVSGCFAQEVPQNAAWGSDFVGVALLGTKEKVYVEITEAVSLHRISNPHCLVPKRWKGNYKCGLWFQLRSQSCLFAAALLEATVSCEMLPTVFRRRRGRSLLTPAVTSSDCGGKVWCK